MSKNEFADKYSFRFAIQNEDDATSVFLKTRMLSSDIHDLITKEHDYSFYDPSIELIHYISDIHLCHILKNKKAKSIEEVKKIIHDVVHTLRNDCRFSGIILFDGDISFDFQIYKLFIAELHNEFADRKVVFTIGNHDLWGLPSSTVDEAVEKYRDLLSQNNMFLLHNEVIYFDIDRNVNYIRGEELVQLTRDELRCKVRNASTILFGGTGFAGYEKYYNASIGLYRYNETIGYSREVELNETKKFERLYIKICEAFYDKNVIILTHMPLSGWYERATEKYNYSEEKFENHFDSGNIKLNAYQSGFVYVSGHTHRNYFYDDGETRLYYDNQFGYNKNNPSAMPHFKYFMINRTYDYFSDYNDGLYEITKDEYLMFSRGKCLPITFNRDVEKIYLLKKNGFYCFLCLTPKKHLCILNGGAMKRLKNPDVSYYFNNMESKINEINKSYGRYYSIQQKISDEIKKLGGDGTIHGCIIDIDFFNHIYLNPLDGKITCYSAKNIIEKYVYPSIPALLKSQCPQLYDNYIKLLNDKQNDYSLSAFSGEELLELKPVPYFNTDIYQASRELYKMQKLNSNILTTWPESQSNTKLLGS